MQPAKRRVARTPSEGMNWVLLTSDLRVGVLNSSSPVLSADRIDHDGMIQTPLRVKPTRGAPLMLNDPVNNNSGTLSSTGVGKRQKSPRANLGRPHGAITLHAPFESSSILL